MKFSRSIMLPIAGLAVIAALSGCGSNNNPLGLTQLDTTPPPAPTNLTLSTNGSGNSILVWDASAAPDVVGYQVEAFSSTGGDFVQAPDPNTGDTSFLLPSATPGAQESYRVRAVDAAGNWSAYSATIELFGPVTAGSETWSANGDGSRGIGRTE